MNKNLCFAHKMFVLFIKNSLVCLDVRAGFEKVKRENSQGIQNRDVERQAKKQLTCLAVNFQQSTMLKHSIC